MTRDPEVERVIAALKRAQSIANSFYADASYYRDDTYDADAADAAAYAATIEAGADLEAAWHCSTLAELLASDRPAVRMAAQFALAPTPTVAAPVAQENPMSKRLLARVIEALDRAETTTHNAFDANYTSANAENAALAASDDVRVAQGCRTLTDLLACDRPAVREAARFALEPTELVAKRVHAALKRAHDAACRADDVASADDHAKLAAGIALVPGDQAREATVVAVENTQADLYAALECKTLANLLACPRPAVRMAAQLALKPPAPKRKRSR